MRGENFSCVISQIKKTSQDCYANAGKSLEFITTNYTTYYERQTGPGYPYYMGIGNKNHYKYANQAPDPHFAEARELTKA